MEDQLSNDIRTHPNPFSQKSLERAIASYEERTHSKASAAIVLYSDYEQGGVLEFGIVGRIGDRLSWGGNLQRKPSTGKWAGHAEVVIAF